MRSISRLFLLLAMALLLHLPGFAQGTPFSTSGNGLQFDGVNDYVNLGSFGPGSTWTIQAWVIPGAVQDGRIALVGGLSGCADWGLVISGGELGVAYRPPASAGACSATLLSGVSIVPGERYHIAATNDGSAVRIYINGDLKNSASVDPNYTATTGGARIGGSVCCGEYFNGIIDEVSIWNRARSTDEMHCSPHLNLGESDFGSNGGCIAYYTFNSINNSIVGDLSGHSHDGTVNGPVPALSRIALGNDCDGVIVTDPGVQDVPAIGGVIEIKTGGWDNNNPDFALAGTLVLAPPEGTQPPGGSTGNDRYWIIEQFGGPVTFTASLTVGLGTPFPSGLGSNPSAASLYTRPGNSIGDWTLVSHAISADATAHTVTFDGFTHFSQYIVRLGDAILPVELAGFDVSLGQDGVVLNWRTASEVNNAGFEVQRAMETGGGSPEFEVIASYRTNPELAGLGTRNYGRSYNFLDPRNQLEPGRTYLYRIVDVTTDGIRMEHPAKSVHIDAGGSVAIVGSLKVAAIVPNPARDVAAVSFELPEAADVTMQIFAENGARAMVPVQAKHYSKGEHSESISLAGLPSGSYTLVVTTGTQSRERRFTIVR
jgi:hypothetical protein